jgi:hypothetical protein
VGAVMTVGVVVVWAGVGDGETGSPGLNGLAVPLWATASDGASANGSTAAATIRAERRARIASYYASGCSMAGVSGAST